MTYRHAPPRASALVESLRGLGYTTATALADIIDNSIAARATDVSLSFTWAGPESRISILDNGTGMTPEELDRAMRLGERSPLDQRSPGDLGRFGLGLKTASFSQCRQLTVASRRDGSEDCLRWDLDVLARSSDDGWHLLEGPAPGSEEFVSALQEHSSGTLVLWEKLDRIISTGFTVQDFLDLTDHVERHLAMIFHRYLQGPSPRLRLTINGRPIAPWDPFLTNHPSKAWQSPVERRTTSTGVIEAECHVLPHKDKLTPSEYDTASGPDGWTSQQGFYVYRNERLLVAGSWLGLGQGRAWTKEEAHRLARIRLDIPNTADSDWAIDIRKSTARPPVELRAWLVRLAEDTRARARHVFAYRGKPAPRAGGKPIAEAWKAVHARSGIRYRIESEHPVVREVLDQAGELLPQIKAMLRIIEETVPVQQIWLDTAEGKAPPSNGFAHDPPSEVKEIMSAFYRNMISRKGLSPEEAREQLLRTDPFQHFPDLVASLPDAT